MLFYFSAFLLIACKDYAWQGFLLAVAVPVMIWVGTNLLPRLFPSDRLLLSLTNFLCALGVLVLYATDPEYAYNQAMYYGVGIAAMIVCCLLYTSCDLLLERQPLGKILRGAGNLGRSPIRRALL